MKLGLICIYTLMVLAFLAYLGGNATAEENSALQAKFDNAHARYNMKRSPIPGFVLTGSITLWLRPDAPSLGKYRLVATPDGKWKEELALPGYSRTRIGDGKQFLQSGPEGVFIPIVYELDRLLNFDRMLGHAEGDSFKAVKPPKTAERAVDCIKRTTKGGAEDIFCFDSQTGDLISHSQSLSIAASGLWQADAEEFSDYQSYSGKSIPRTMRAFKGKQVYVEAKIDEIKPLGQLPEHFLDAAPDAVAWGDCDERSAWKLDYREQPRYPESARNARQQGVVTMYTVIESDGHVSALRVVASAGKNLDDAAMAAVSRWRYKATGCSGAPGRADTIIDVIFSLQY